MCPTSNLDSPDGSRHDGGAIPRYRLAPSHATSLRGYSANYRSAAVDAAARRESTTTTLRRLGLEPILTFPAAVCRRVDLENCVRRIRRTVTDAGHV